MGYSITDGLRLVLSAQQLFILLGCVSWILPYLVAEWLSNGKSFSYLVTRITMYGKIIIMMTHKLVSYAVMIQLYGYHACTYSKKLPRYLHFCLPIKTPKGQCDCWLEIHAISYNDVTKDYLF